MKRELIVNDTNVTTRDLEHVTHIEWNKIKLDAFTVGYKTPHQDLMYPNKQLGKIEILHLAWNKSVTRIL